MDAAIDLRGALPASMFTLRNPEELSAFLRQHPGAAGLVRAAAERLPDYFPGDAVEIEIDVDPDDDTDPALFVAVRTRQPAQNALAALDRFDRDFWLPTLKALLPAQSPVVVTVRRA